MNKSLLSVVDFSGTDLHIQTQQNLPPILDIPKPKFDLDDENAIIAKEEEKEGYFFNSHVNNVFRQNHPKYKFIGISKKDYCIPTLDIESTIPRISADTLAQIIHNEYSQFFSNIVIFDCRFFYEYKGGHIYSSINLLERKQLETIYSRQVLIQQKEKMLNTNNSNSFNQDYSDVPNIEKSVCFIFHCEFSTVRGPAWASLLRNMDRYRNSRFYPKLDFENVFILDGGYQCFYEKYPELTTGGYRPMDDQNVDGHFYLRECQRKFEREIGEQHNGSKTPQIDKTKFYVDLSLDQLDNIKFCSQPFQ